MLYSSDVLSGLKNRATATINYSQKIGADLLVIMSDQDAELSGFFLGQYTLQVIHHSKVPVIAITPEINSDGTDISLLSGTSGL